MLSLSKHFPNITLRQAQGDIVFVAFVIQTSISFSYANFLKTSALGRLVLFLV